MGFGTSSKELWREMLSLFDWLERHRGRFELLVLVLIVLGIISYSSFAPADLIPLPQQVVEFRDSDGALVGSHVVQPPRLLFGLVLGFGLAAIWIFVAGTRLNMRRQREVTATPVLAGPESSSGLPLQATLTALIDQGRELRRRCLQMGEPPPELAITNWEGRVRYHLDDNYGNEQGSAWLTHARRGEPNQKLTAMGTLEQINLWKKVAAGVEWLEDFERRAY